jgi:hypothetical protein
MLRQIDSSPPNLDGHGPGLGSGDWVPRNTVARVGALLFGSVFAASGLMMIASSFLLKGEFQRLISSPPIAYVVSFVAAAMTLTVASFLIWYGGRLVMGSFRRSPNRSGKKKSRDKEFHV